MTVLHKLQGFFEELRLNGVPITPSNAMDCCQAVLQIDWTREDYFYSALYSTLLKDFAYQEIFDQVFQDYFTFPSSQDPTPEKRHPGSEISLLGPGGS
jgi:uncharacterized protein with von Willebrand factor type A (vWA) domain